MQKKIFISIIFLFSVKALAQNLENLKLRDTIYLMFDENQKFDDLHLNLEKSKYVETYIYGFPDAKDLVFFVYLKEQLKSNLKKKKVFLNETKLKTITTEQMQSIGYFKMVKLISEKKIVVFIINKKDIKCKKTLLKRAYLGNILPSEI